MEICVFHSLNFNDKSHPKPEVYILPEGSTYYTYTLDKALKQTFYFSSSCTTYC